MSGYTEDTLVQQTTADYLEQQLGWESVYAYNNEDFGPDSLLGRGSDREVVLTRTLRQKLVELNPVLLEPGSARGGLRRRRAADHRNGHRADRDTINIVYKSLQQDRERADITDIIRQLHQVVDEAIETQPDHVGEESEPYDISKIDFDRLKQEFERSPVKRTTVQNLKQAIEQRLQRLLLQNPLRTDFQRHYEDIVAEYNREKDRVTIEKTFEALLKLIEELDEEDR